MVVLVGIGRAIKSVSNILALTLALIVAYIWQWSPIAAILLTIAGPPVVAATPFLLLSWNATQIALLIAFPLWIALFVWWFS